MKQIKTILILMIGMLVLSSLVSAVADKAYLTATMKNYEPQPAEPGKYVNVYVQLENTGTATAENVKLEFVPSYPFSLDPGESKTKYIGLLGGGTFNVVEFRVKVDPNAVEGINKIKFRYNLDKDEQFWAEKELDLSIQTGNAVLAADKISVDPEEISPGEKGTVTIRLKNLADSYLSDIKVNLDISSDSIPFAPMNSAVEKDLYQLMPGQTHDFEFNIIAYPDATAGVYKIPLSVTYNDNVGSSYTKEDLVGVIVNAKPEINVVVDSTTLTTESKTGTITLKIVNKGLSNLKLMNLEVEQTDGFELISPSKQEYIGNLDSDDFETVEYRVIIKSNNVDIPLKLTYRDSNNKLYTDDMKIKLNVHSADKLGETSGSSAWMWIVLIVIVVGVFIYLRRRKKKKQKQQ